MSEFHSGQIVRVVDTNGLGEPYEETLPSGLWEVREENGAGAVLLRRAGSTGEGAVWLQGWRIAPATADDINELIEQLHAATGEAPKLAFGPKVVDAGEDDPGILSPEKLVELDTKPTNPKDAIGSTKLPISLWPETATALGCLGLLEGALKYGRLNWREAGVRASIYVDALRRHMAAWFEGEDEAPDSGLPHLAHALACLAILVDAQAAGKLVDDRQFSGAGYRPLVESLTPHVARLQEKYDAFDPKHYSIADNS